MLATGLLITRVARSRRFLDVALDHRVVSGGTALAVGRYRLQESRVTRRRAKMLWTSPGIETLVICKDGVTFKHRHSKPSKVTVCGRAMRAPDVCTPG
jgi:hypothetical protein